ncbi:MAG: hypothetical protein JXM70_08970 [Pirellulales bacterium]|nr:hypothetical protein [Pirellulales bacterium]
MVYIQRNVKIALAVPFITALVIVTGNAKAAEPDWDRPDPSSIRTLSEKWLAGKNPSDAVKRKVESIWTDLPKAADGTELLTRVAMTFATQDRRAAALVEICSRPRDRGPVPAQTWLSKDPPDTADRFVTVNMRLLYARWLTSWSMYDEASEYLSGLAPEDVVDPDSLLFFQAVIQHRLLKKDEALATIERLLQRSDDCPLRYRSLARLMQADLKGLEDETLDHIARRMDDVRRRLDLGRPGEKTRKIEDGIIESLDKLIKKLEQQQQQQAQSGGGGSTQPSNPAGDSQVMGGRGPGRVVKRSVGAKSGWGNLPAKDREEALQQVNRQFPAHYREVIEQYFRRLADKEE